MDKNKELVIAAMKKATQMSASERNAYVARLIGDVYDVELPIANPLDLIVDVQHIEQGEHAYYLTPASVTKKLYVISSGCTVTQQNVTPNTQTELTLGELFSPEYNVCLKDWLGGDHNVLKLNADAIGEAMDRQEIYNALALLDAGAVATSNVFGLRSGETTFVYQDAVEMARSVAKYGRRLILIAGANIVTDIMLWNSNPSQFNKVSLADAGITLFPIEELDVTLDGVATTVLDADTAYLVAVSDSAARKPIVMARRKLSSLSAFGAVEVAKERIVIDMAPNISVGSARKAAIATFGMEEYGAVLLNNKICSKYVRA